MSKRLGLRVSMLKTEALLFHGPHNGPLHRVTLRIQNWEGDVRAQVRYLGLILDSCWLTKIHFAQLAQKIVNAARALGRVLLNVGGPNSPRRRLYVCSV